MLNRILHTHALWASLLALLCLSAFVAAARAGDDDPEGDYLPGEVVVRLAQASDLPGVAADYALDPTPLDQFGTRPIFRLSILDSADPEDKADALAADLRVQYAEPNFVVQAPESRQRTPWAIGVGDDDYASQWAPDLIGLPAAHTVARGAGIVVAVLDTGVDATHPALAGRLVPGYDFVDDDADPSEVGVYDANPAFGHGTHVAGLIALAAPDASIMPIRVLDPDGVGNVWVLAEALSFAADPDGNPATDDGADVINLSLGTGRSTNLFEELIEALTCGDDDDDADDDESCTVNGGRGIVIVAAAGNRGANVEEYPAAEYTPGLLAVAASTPTDTLAAFSSFGEWVHVAAPGESIVSTVPGGGYGAWSGTSMAAPLAAGQAALLMEAYPQWPATEVTSHIRQTAAVIAGPVPLRINVALSLGQFAGSERVYFPAIFMQTP